MTENETDFNKTPAVDVDVDRADQESDPEPLPKTTRLLFPRKSVPKGINPLLGFIRPTVEETRSSFKTESNLVAGENSISPTEIKPASKVELPQLNEEGTSHDEEETQTSNPGEVVRTLNQITDRETEELKDKPLNNESEDTSREHDDSAFQE